MLKEQEQYKKFLHDNYGAVITDLKLWANLILQKEDYLKMEQ